jgi:peptidoglycan hydrolase-like protein with peptidoglycan-binding domain
VAPGEPRILRLVDPPLSGDDVVAVQHSLAASNLPTDQDGNYGPLTAAGVARFQKQNQININGVVDPVTREKLGVK